MSGAGGAQDSIRGAVSLGPGEGPAFYDRWADTYEAEVTAAGYAAPERVARALVAAGADLAAPVLDFGCGTGLSGLALRAAGFATIDGWDASPRMLAAAGAKGVYRSLTAIPPAPPYPGATGDWAAIDATGALLPGHAPPAAVDALLKLLAPGGLLAFNLSDRALADPAYVGRVNEWVDCGGVEVAVKEYGPSLPGAGVGATVYVLRRRERRGGAARPLPRIGPVGRPVGEPPGGSAVIS